MSKTNREKRKEHKRKRRERAVRRKANVRRFGDGKKRRWEFKW